MNKHKHILTRCCLLLALMASGCQKFLAVKSDKKLVVPQSLGDMQALMDDAVTMNLRTTPSYGEASADDYFLTPAALSPLGNIGREVYLWKDFNYSFQNDWSVGYAAIYNTNLTLDILGTNERNSANAQTWDHLKGSALFYRAYYELGLLGQYGLAYDSQKSSTDLGIVLRRSSDFNVPSKRSTVAQCYQAILEDLDSAIPLLPELPQHVYRPSKASAHALLSRVHLYMRNYPAALDHTESALALRSSLMDYNSDSDIFSQTAAVPFKPLNKEIIFYTEMFSWYGLQSPTRALIDPDLYASYGANDLRRNLYFLANGANQRFKGSYASHVTGLFTGLATDELYLTRAECLAYLDRSPEGMDVLNTFLKTRWRNTATYVPLTASNKADALSIIRAERRKSLLMRGLRWMDIKRQNREGAAITPKRIAEGVSHTLAPNSPRYALPLPADILEETGMPQN
ncbi:RagB/SusD family nutrient uptake outer membrane protein [Pedobacter sp.]